MLGDSIERWEVTAGDKLLIFQNDRPERMRSKSNRVVKWKVIEGLDYVKDPVRAADTMTNIWDAIETYSGPKEPTFEQVRNKNW